MNKDQNGFFFQDDPVLNERKAWTADEFPQANYHFFRDSGCIMTSIWNMCYHYQVPRLQEEFPTPWELNEACKAKGIFYPNANIELAFLDRVLPVSYRDRIVYEESALREQFTDGTMCILRVNGQNGPYHYVLPLPSSEDELRCFDPKAGYTSLRSYEKVFQIIRFQRL